MQDFDHKYLLSAMSSVITPNFPSSLPLAQTRSWSRFHQSQVSSLAFSDDGNFLATGDRDGIVYIFDVTKDMPVACLYFDSSVATTCILWCGSSKLWIGASDGSITCWNFIKTAHQPVAIDAEGIFEGLLTCSTAAAACRCGPGVSPCTSSDSRLSRDSERYDPLLDCSLSEHGRSLGAL